MLQRPKKNHLLCSLQFKYWGWGTHVSESLDKLREQTREAVKGFWRQGQARIYTIHIILFERFYIVVLSGWVLLKFIIFVITFSLGNGWAVSFVTVLKLWVIGFTNTETFWWSSNHWIFQCNNVSWKRSCATIIWIIVFVLFSLVFFFNVILYHLFDLFSWFE